MIDPLLLDLPPSFSSPRLEMRSPRAGDGAVMLPALQESLPQLRRFLASLPWVAADPTSESTEIFCRNSQANFLARKDFPFLIFEKDGGRFAGVIGLHRPDWNVPKVEIGYWVRTSCAGKGLVTEAANAVCEYAFLHFNALRLEIVTDEANVESRRVAERAGFVLEGIQRNHRRSPDGSLRNTCLYARLR
jgi:RimJ/RimL family protein N-acetyltransferase